MLMTHFATLNIGYRSPLYTIHFANHLHALNPSSAPANVSYQFVGLFLYCNHFVPKVFSYLLNLSIN